MEKTKTLIYDIETTPLVGTAWQKWDTNLVWISKEWYILCFAYKWLGEKETHVVALPDYKKEYKQDPSNDFRVIERLHQLFTEADVIIAHNGDKFDKRKSSARFLYHGFAPPAPYKTVDTLKVARKYFALTSNHLNDIGQTLGVGKKVSTGGYELWRKCMDGDPKAWELMCRYNKQDVILLEKIYLKLRPWIGNHPPAVPEDNRVCPRCGSKRIQFRGYLVNATTKYRRIQCQSCGGWSRFAQTERVEKPLIAV